MQRHRHDDVDPVEDLARRVRHQRAEWVLMDYFNFIVHVFAPQTREFYSLERLWGDAERIDVSDDPAADSWPA